MLERLRFRPINELSSLIGYIFVVISIFLFVRPTHIAMVQAAIRRSVSRGLLTPRASSVLVAGAGDQAIHGRRARLFDADAAAAADIRNIVKAFLY